MQNCLLKKIRFIFFIETRLTLIKVDWRKVAVITSICICLIGADVHAGGEPVVRVLLLESRDLLVRVDKNKSLIVLKGLGKFKKRIESIKVRLRNDQIQYLISPGPKVWQNLYLGNRLILTSRNERGLWLNNRRYSGELLIELKNKKLRVINYLTVEKYLKSVVGGEMPKNWPIEALKAQSVAARTYVLKRLNKNKPYDVFPTSQSQVYIGIESETASTKKAVNRTRALVLTYQGQLIDAVFHSSSGGRTESSKDLWGRSFPYLVSVIDDNYQGPNKNWDMEFTPSDLKDKFPETGGLNIVRILDYSDSGRVSKVRIYGPTGNLELSGKELRKRLNLKSTLVDFQIIKFKDHSKTKKKYLFNKNKEIKIQSLPPTNNLSSIPRPLPEIPKDYSLLVRGYGSGHGVGLSQWGAYSMAKKGASFRQILRHYYNGIRIVPYSK